MLLLSLGNWLAVERGMRRPAAHELSLDWLGANGKYRLSLARGRCLVHFSPLSGAPPSIFFFMSSFSQPAESPSAAPAGPPRAKASPAHASGPSWVEITVIVAALVALAVLRWCSVYSHRWNTDEPQHLHVVWAWTVGLLQYRDIFDNHTPLFHMLNAPLLRWLGERADIVIQMRRAMIPLFAVSVWCVYRLGVVVYDRRIGWFAALLAGFL